jgi:hypothetical protein
LVETSRGSEMWEVTMGWACGWNGKTMNTYRIFGGWGGSLWGRQLGKPNRDSDGDFKTV